MVTQVLISHDCSLKDSECMAVVIDIGVQVYSIVRYSCNNTVYVYNMIS